MSASRKKQERKLAEAAELSAREQEEIVKAEQRKRNTIIYSIIGVVVVILAAILLIWDSGVIQRNSSVATIDGEKVTPAQFSFHYSNNPVVQTANYYAQYGMTFPYSLSEPARTQVITEEDIANMGLGAQGPDASYVGKTYHEYFVDNALNTLREEYALLAAAKEAGYKLSEQGKAAVEEELIAIDNAVEAYMSYGYNFTRATYLEQIYGNSMTVKAFRSCVENSMLASEYYETSLVALADYSEAELNAYYQANTDKLDSVRYYFRAFSGTAETTTDADGKTVEPTEEESAAAMAKAKEEADAEAEKVKGNLAAVEGNEDYTEQAGVLNPTSFYYDWLIDSSRKAGDSTVFEGTTNYYVVVYADRFLDESATADVRHILVQAVNEDDPATEDVNEATEAPTDEVFAAAEKQAFELLKQWEQGSKDAASFGLLANEYSADTGSNTNGGLYTHVAQGDMIGSFNDWVFAEGRKPGDTGLVKNTESYIQGWHVIYYQNDNEPIWVTTARQALWAKEVADTMEIVRTDKLDSVVD